ncbi:hypothetical protein [Streptomyces sp. Da 82-17]|uniref:hypothetical protein n=1 Tax=Streptomyces sp. Da 82-17 TaxID=3377116 RepID=UPI0038D3D5D7
MVPPDAWNPYTGESGLVRPYIDLTPVPEEPGDAERRAQAARRWALEMAALGVDVGPEVIHGVRVGAACVRCGEPWPVKSVSPLNQHA